MGDPEPLNKSAFRPLISAANMHGLFSRMFAESKRKCASCLVPFPFWGPGAGSSTGYWYLPTPDPCSNGCDRVLLELWARITAQYQIEPPVQELATWKNGSRTAKSK